jgi:peptide/nickel transport system permease protein
MRWFVLRRLGLMVPTFLGMTLLTFVIAQLAPGDPFALDPEQSRGATVADGRAAHGLDAPLIVQYARWLGHVVQFDFGRSFVDQRAVRDKLIEAFPRTALVSGLSWLLAYGLAIPFGVWLATSRRRATEALAAALTLTWSVPSFWVGVLLLLAFASPSGWEVFPLQGLGQGGWSTAWHLVLPVTCLTLPTLALATRQVRRAMSAALASDYVLAARARGIPTRRVVWRHALRNSLVPVVTLAGLSLPHLVGGSVVIERIFGIPGMGLLAFDAVGSRDYPTVMGVATVMAVATLGSMLLVDLSYGWLDPRVRAPSEAS